MFRPFRDASFILSIIASSLFAGPKIEFNTKAFNCGTVFEGKTEKLNAIFIIKNTGNAVLKLINVRPGCGCTVVKYDTLIQPGKTAKIESQVNIKGYHSGQISKSITVTSNAENDPTVRLTIDATIKTLIDISDSYLNLNASNVNIPHSVYLSSKKSDLNISEILFKLNGSSDVPEWQSSIPLSLKYKWAPTDSVRSDSCRVFKLDIFTPDIEKTVSGEFIIKTNHPDKSEIKLTGNINK